MNQIYLSVHLTIIIKIICAPTWFEIGYPIVGETTVSSALCLRQVSPQIKKKKKLKEYTLMTPKLEAALQ